MAEDVQETLSGDEKEYREAECLYGPPVEYESDEAYEKLAHQIHEKQEPVDYEIEHEKRDGFSGVDSAGPFIEGEKLDRPAKNNVQQQTPVMATWKLTKYAYVEDPLGDTPVSTIMQDTVNIMKLQKKASISFLPTAVYLSRTLYMIIRVTMSEDMCINDVPIWNIRVLEISTVRA
ncbi:hypothetical protein KL909_001448 [Ogataea angusta]|uniref:Uncharacterized protein n=1 Tax=Pichia angusta TaxID=870730 RepID=A0AAN6I5A2_PICAN|nr:uncharacterized protein KL928_002777 [Ogataea angusta]KAG7818909.1 hypothetical protein KL928_002777 [Ogataea angusta]KAG7825156.1 hypothetical protein KL909_001448 [Ogataea angusta]KAG7861871.1 hypothetical protein KL939_000892 [Ogataea angusta]